MPFTEFLEHMQNKEKWVWLYLYFRLFT
jgi:hypothetical protein